MDRQAEITVMSIALLMLQDADKQRVQDAYASGAKVPWYTFDALADAFRAGGVDPNAPALGNRQALDADLAEDEALVAERVEIEHDQELDRKLRERPKEGT